MSATGGVTRTTYLGVKLVENVLEVVAFDGLLRVEKVKELLDELGRHVDFEGADLNRLVDNQLKEKLVDTLEVGPRGVHLFFLIDSRLSEVQIALLDVGQGAEDVLLNHLHDLVEVGDDHAHDVFLVLKHLLELGNGVEALSLSGKMGKNGQARCS